MDAVRRRLVSTGSHVLSLPVCELRERQGALARGTRVRRISFACTSAKTTRQGAAQRFVLRSARQKNDHFFGKKGGKHRTASSLRHPRAFDVKMGRTMRTRNQGKQPKQRAGRDGGVCKRQVRPKNCGRAPSATSIQRYYDPAGKLRRKPLGTKKQPRWLQEPVSSCEATAPHLQGSRLLGVLYGNKRSANALVYFLDPNSMAARLGYSTTTMRRKTGLAVSDKAHEKECGTESGAAATCSVCQVTVGDTYFGMPVKACMIAIDHHTEEVSSWNMSKRKGTAAAQLKAGVAQFLCLFCNADKSPSDCVHFTPL